MITAVWFSALASAASFNHATAHALLQAGGGDRTAPPAEELARVERVVLPAGMWWSDFDKDGLNDAYAIALTGAGHLLRNAGDGTFQDVTHQAGLGAIASPSLAVWNDYDKDGDPDLYIGSSVLMQNNGDGTFQDVSRHVGIGHAGQDLGAEWVDYDRDGHVDLFVRTNVGDHVYHALANGGFESVDLGLPRSPTGEGVPLGSAEETEIAPAPDDVRTGDRGAASRPAPAVRNVLSTGETVLVSTGGVPTPESGSSPGNGSVGPFGFALPICADMIIDQTSLACIEADSTPTLGRLYPLGPEFNINGASGNVGVNVSPADALHRVDVNAGTLSTINGSSGVRSVALNGPTNGYVGVIGNTDHDGVTSADWFNFEIGLAGISTGGTVTDNYGVMGHSNNVGVRGEHSTAPATDFGELGLAGIGVRASGSASAAEFLAPVRLRSGAVETLTLGNNNLGSGGIVNVRDGAGLERLTLQVDNFDGGAVCTFEAADGSDTIELDAQAGNSGGALLVRNDTGADTVQLLGDRATSNSGGIRLVDQNGPIQLSIELEAEDDFGTGSQIRLEGTTAGQHTIELDGSDGSQGQIDILEGDGSLAFRFFSSSLTLHNAAGTVTQTYNRLTGAKSAVVETPSYGQRLLYVLESPEVWFEDFGSAQLVNGQARVNLDPVFLETVTINEQHPMKVFITLTGDCNGVFVEKGRDHFVVRELGGGTSNASFDWRMVAKRRGLETARLDDWAAEEAAMLKGSDGAPYIHRTAPPDGADHEEPQVQQHPAASQAQPSTEARSDLGQAEHRPAQRPPLPPVESVRLNERGNP